MEQGSSRIQDNQRMMSEGCEALNDDGGTSHDDGNESANCASPTSRQQQQQTPGMDISTKSLPVFSDSPLNKKEGRRRYSDGSTMIGSGNKRGLYFRSWARNDSNGSNNSSSRSFSFNSSSSTRRRGRLFHALGRGGANSNNKDDHQQDQQDLSEQANSPDDDDDDDDISMGALKKSNHGKKYSTTTTATSKNNHDSDITSMTTLMFRDNCDDQSQEGAAVSADDSSGDVALDEQGQGGNDHASINDSDESTSSCQVIMNDDDDGDNDDSSDGGSIMFQDTSEQGRSNRDRYNKIAAAKAKAVRDFNTFRLICGKIVNHKRVQQLIVALIILNALQMGLATFDFVDKNPDLEAAFEKADFAFLVVFTVELAFQLVYHGYHLFQDGWLRFDFLIVICSWSLASLQVFRTLRTLRLVARVESLKNLIQALVESLPRVTGILFLFSLFMYIYGVMITILFGDLHERGYLDMDYFSRLDITLFTLFQMITLDFAKIVRQVMVLYPYAWLVFSSYLTFTSFILFSMIIAVVCDAVSVVEQDSNLLEELETKESVQERILKLQHRVDYLKKEQESAMAKVTDVLVAIQQNGHLDEFSLPLSSSRTNTTHTTASSTSNHTGPSKAPADDDDDDDDATQRATSSFSKLHTD